MSKYEQIKELPFSKVGSVWDIEFVHGEELILNIDNENYSYCSPSLWTGLVRYYFDIDEGLDMTSDGYFKKLPKDSKAKAEK